MATHLKVIQSDRAKGKSATKTQEAAEELDYLMTFNRSINQAMARTKQDLSEGIFIDMANQTLTRQDRYMDYLKAGIKQDALRTTPIHMGSLFADHLLATAEEEITHHDEKRSAGTFHKKPARFHPYTHSGKQAPEADRKSGPPAWKQLKQFGQAKGGRGKASNYQQ